jgi:hypothetical protein
MHLCAADEPHVAKRLDISMDGMKKHVFCSCDGLGDGFHWLGECLKLPPGNKETCCSGVSLVLCETDLFPRSYTPAGNSDSPRRLA